MVWTVRGSSPGGSEFSAPAQNGPMAHQVSYTMGVGLFPEVKRPGNGVDHSLPSSAEGEGRVEFYLYSPCVPA